jgi:cell division protein ZapE
MTLTRYEKILHQNNITLNAAQAEILTALTELDNSIDLNEDRGLLSSILPNSVAIKGVYIYGSFGTGKSMLMDLFYDNLEIKKKQKVHFNAFMLEVHAYLHKAKKKNKKDIDFLTHVAKYIAKQYKVLCIDELQIDDIADAMIVGKLFRELLKEQVILVITSNFAPDELYPDGLQRDSFLPFIELMQAQMQVLKMNHNHDFRIKKLKSVETVYFVYQEAMDSQRFILDSFAKLTNNSDPVNMLLNIDGRELLCPITAQDCCVFTFDQLCGSPLASSDYIAICQEFNVIIIAEIPELTSEDHNEAKRFISFVDTAYDLRKILICSAKTDIESIYKAGKWHYVFKRTISRLHEMQSQEYLES